MTTIQNQRCLSLCYWNLVMRCLWLHATMYSINSITNTIITTGTGCLYVYTIFTCTVVLFELPLSLFADDIDCHRVVLHYSTMIISSFGRRLYLLIYDDDDGVVILWILFDSILVPSLSQWYCYLLMIIATKNSGKYCQNNSKLDIP